MDTGDPANIPGAAQKAASDQMALDMAIKLKALNSDLHGIKGLAGLAAAAPKVVAAVEEAGKASALDGDAKRQLAIGVVLALVPLPPWLPRAWAMTALSWLLEKAVAQFNGHALPAISAAWAHRPKWLGGV